MELIQNLYGWTRIVLSCLSQFLEENIHAGPRFDDKGATANSP